MVSYSGNWSDLDDDKYREVIVYDQLRWSASAVDNLVQAGATICAAKFAGPIGT